MIEKIAIIIPVFNGLEHLKKTLPRIYQQIINIQLVKFQVIVVDDHSSDGSRQWVMNSYPETVLLEGNGNLWWSGGINEGIQWVMREKGFQFVLLWNHDNLSADDYFRNLADCLHDYDNKTILASKIYFADRPNIIFNMGVMFNSRTGKHTLIGYGREDSEAFDKPVQVDWTGGMGTLIPVKAFDEVGLFDRENFPQYHGDSDFFLRARSKGYRLMILPGLKIWNDKTSSGIEHNGSWKYFFRSLTSIKSNHNVIVSYTFLKKHCTSSLAYVCFAGEQVTHFSSFLKHWFINLFR
jgi:GT2 family glycosyltransferase